jgi:hypothetical protein
MPTRLTVRPVVIAFALLGAEFVHDVAYFVWLNVDHESADGWMHRLGAVVFVHCWGESGPMSHLPEVLDASIPVGAVLGAIGLPFAGVALARCRTRDATLFAVSAFVCHFVLVLPGAALLWNATHTEHREIPRSWYARRLEAHANERSQPKKLRAGRITARPNRQDHTE